MAVDVSYAIFKARHSELGFSDWLVSCCPEAWHGATHHAFTIALGDGTLDEAAFKDYLLQDYAFVKDLASALGYLVAQAPTMEAKQRLAAFLAQLTSAENDYFIRSFAALGIEETQYSLAQEGEVLRKITGTLLSAAGKGKYEDGLACLLCAEWVYMEWGRREGLKPRPAQFYFAEWIDLHCGPEFEGFVGWLRSQMDTYGAQLTERRQKEVAERFVRMCELEQGFFDSVMRV
ncbi:TenA family protein [Polycladidibacter hongkongensis]|uniref:TenA family protein n=1 Tax=Polycladidibacter hongkongensis TaxID=1647556 RepID=UPI00082DC0C5|nr:TenA family protein [Pseudovibrio hongkongensis]